jgi:hypothetical protein
MIVISNNLVLSPLAVPGPDNAVIGWHNIVTSGNIAADSSLTGFPASNMANPATFLKWKAAAFHDEHVTITTGTVEPIDYVAIAGHNLGSSQTPVSIEGRTGAADPFEKVLLHFDGADGSTTIIDSNRGGSAHSWTANGNAQIDTAQSKFSGALLCDGIGDWVDANDSADFTLGSNDFTIDFWFSVNEAGGSFMRLAGQVDNTDANTLSAWSVLRLNTNVMFAQVFVAGVALAIAGTTQFTDVLNVGFHHLAFVRTGSTLKMFIDGVQEGGDVAIAGSVNDSAAQIRVGACGANSDPWQGWIDEFRLRVGTAAWTANFTPPVAPAEWTRLVQDVILPDDGPALFRFVPQTLSQIRIRLQDGNAPAQIAVVYCGLLLVMERGLYDGHTPLTYARKVEVTNGRSERGQFLGRIVTGESLASAAAFTLLTPAWFRASMDPFLIAAKERPFFFAWRPQTYPREVGYAWLVNDPVPVNTPPSKLISIELQMGGLANV